MVAMTDHPTNVTVALDLWLVVTFGLLGGVWLSRGRGWGLVISTVWTVKGALYMTALSAASVAAYRMGAAPDLAQLALWVPIGVACGLGAFVLLVDGEGGGHGPSCATASPCEVEHRTDDANTPGDRGDRMTPKGLPHAGSTLVVLLSATGCGVESPDSSTALPAEPLFTQIEYHHAGTRGEVDEAGRSLVWMATMEGDLAAEGRWYFEPDPVPDPAFEEGSITFYQARWEIRVDDRVILEGRSAGKTVSLSAQDFIWDGHGVVTDASPEYRAYVGRPVSETGPVLPGDYPPASSWGRGLFTIH